MSSRGPGRSRKVHLLESVSSVLKPGRFTLLLGPPGACLGAPQAGWTAAAAGLLRREPAAGQMNSHPSRNE